MARRRTVRGSLLRWWSQVSLAFPIQSNTQMSVTKPADGLSGQWELSLVNSDAQAGKSEVILEGRGLGLYRWVAACEEVMRGAAASNTVLASCLLLLHQNFSLSRLGQCCVYTLGD